MQSSVDLIAFNVPFSAASQDPAKVFLTAEVNTTEASKSPATKSENLGRKKETRRLSEGLPAT